MRTKKEEILEAAFVVFSEKGYHRATVDEIVNLAATGKGTVYNYFSCKEGLFHAVIENQQDKLCRKLEGLVGRDTSLPTSISDFIRIYLEFLVENSQLWRTMVGDPGAGREKIRRKELIRRRFLRVVSVAEQILEKGQTRGDVQFDDLKLAGRLLVNMIHASALHGEPDEPLDELTEKLTRLYLYGVSSRLT
ncbi:MAG: TetR/AcrR family transcriptional regulator [Limnochordia bacterium]|nr:TetR/AcrR family transcriptional regulator [Limnochordia bacterium]MDD2628887.1 TetR/AcrR family transcriptional regulator [Limnochordia bacterium]